MMTIGDETLIAFADGELTGIRRAELERALAGDPELRARLERQQRLRALIAGHYAPVEDEPVPDRFTALLAVPAEDNVVDFAAAKQRRARPLWQSLTALAATLVLGLIAGQMLPGGEGGPVAMEGGTMVARGDLADALDRRLAGDQGGETRIGVSFAAADGRFCRTFDGAEMSGLACRGDAGWQLVATAPGSGAAGAEYRQASSGNALVLGAAQEMMAGEPLDAAGERRARDTGWRNSPGRD
jgi:hypothetical protein